MEVVLKIVVASFLVQFVPMTALLMSVVVLDGACAWIGLKISFFVPVL